MELAQTFAWSYKMQDIITNVLGTCVTVLFYFFDKNVVASFLLYLVVGCPLSIIEKDLVCFDHYVIFLITARINH